MYKMKWKNEKHKTKKHLLFMDVPVNPSTPLLTGIYGFPVDCAPITGEQPLKRFRATHKTRAKGLFPMGEQIM